MVIIIIKKMILIITTINTINKSEWYHTTVVASPNNQILPDDRQLIPWFILDYSPTESHCWQCHTQDQWLTRDPSRCDHVPCILHAMCVCKFVDFAEIRYTGKKSVQSPIFSIMCAQWGNECARASGGRSIDAPGAWLYTSWWEKISVPSGEGVAQRAAVSRD